MSSEPNEEKDLNSSQRLFLVLLSIFLVVSLFFFKNEFKPSFTLDQLARNSPLPEEALSNGRPTIIEFYADWCEACKEMAPSMISVKKRNENKLDVVLLDVDNPQWIDLIDKYDVRGIPQLNFFDENGDFRGFSLGVKNESELNDIFYALINDKELPSFSRISNTSYLNTGSYSEESITISNLRFSGPRSHN